MGSANLLNERPVPEPQLGAADGSFVSGNRHCCFGHLEGQQFALFNLEAAVLDTLTKTPFNCLERFYNCGPPFIIMSFLSIAGNCGHAERNP